MKLPKLTRITAPINDDRELVCTMKILRQTDQKAVINVATYERDSNMDIVPDSTISICVEKSVLKIQNRTASQWLALIVLNHQSPMFSVKNAPPGKRQLFSNLIAIAEGKKLQALPA